MFTNDAKAVIALTTRLGSRERPALSPKAWHMLAMQLKESEMSPASVFDRTIDLGEIEGIDPETASRARLLADGGGSALLEADELHRKGIWIRTVTDDNYPEVLPTRLASATPPVLYGVGSPSLLDSTGIGIVGSRNVSPAGAEVAKSLARQAVALGRCVVSGGARGVDQLAMNAAFGTDGQVVGVLADSLEAQIKKPDVLSAIERDQVCLISQQTPSVGFSPAAAMSRNKLIYGFSWVTVVIATDHETGGTWAGATEALRSHNGLVAVWRGEGEGPGNAELVRRGGREMTDTNQLAALLEEEPVASEQLSLLD